VQASLYAVAVGALFHPAAYHFYFYYIARLAVALIKMDGGRGAGSDPVRPTLPRGGA
jgi:hypothetical protein